MIVQSWRFYLGGGGGVGGHQANSSALWMIKPVWFDYQQIASVQNRQINRASATHEHAREVSRFVCALVYRALMYHAESTESFTYDKSPLQIILPAC